MTHFKKNVILVFLSLLISYPAISQTCTNDSLIIDTINLIPNPSFSELVNSTTCLPDGIDCPPAYFTSLDCVPGWVQANVTPATNDVISLCYAENFLEDYVPYFQNGDEIFAGGYLQYQPADQNSLHEYIGNTFTETLKADSTYRFSVLINMGFTYETGFLLNSYTISQIGKMYGISLFGNTTNSNFPYPVFNGLCPTVAHPDDYIELGITQVELSGQNEWVEINMELTPPVDIYHFIFGPSCTQPDLDVVEDVTLFNYMIMDSFEIIQILENPFFNNLDIALDIQNDPCSNESTLIAPDFSDGTYLWFFNDEPLLNDTLSTLELLNQPENEGSYFVEVFDGLGNCGYSDTISFFYENNFALSESITDVTCHGDSSGSIELSISNPDDWIFEWINEAGDIIGTDQELNAIPAGNYFLMLTDDEDCTFDFEYFVDEPSPLFLEATSVATGCIGGELGLITALAQGGVPDYLYSIDGFSFTENNAFDLVAGTYNLEVQDANGCVITLDEVVVESGIPFFVTITASENPVTLGDPLTLSLNANRPLEGASIQWISPVPIPCDSCTNISVDLFDSGSFSVSVVDATGCIGEANIQIDIDKQRTVFIPNIFSPNNDGINDRFEIFPGKAVDRILQFKVFDRWGALVHDNPTIGWDGYFKNENKQAGVYTWFAEVQFLDGLTRIYRGDVSLVR